MTGYADTSFLVSLYLFDANSVRAQAAAISYGASLPFSALLRWKCETQLN
jgi:hypothetical protein